MSNFSNKEKQQEYKKKLIEENFDKNLKPQEKWNNITEKITEISKEVMGIKEKNQKTKDDKIGKMSEESQKIRRIIDSCKTQEEKEKWKKERQKIKSEIQKELSTKQRNEIEAKLTHMEQIKNDANKYYQAIRELKRNKKKTELVVENDEGEIVGSHTEPNGRYFYLFSSTVVH